MKTTKCMLCLVACYLITYLFLGLLGYLISNNYTYKECLTHPVYVCLMIFFGWIPAAIVTIDYSDQLDKK